ncbi:MAG: transcription antitermination factor NusB [Clostridia bacterium]|nr:transcription antitermination factor NusB [Clostridia bacterium]
MNRKEAREEAFILIFEKEFSKDSLEDILEIAEQVRDVKPDDYIKKVFFGAFENIDEIDGAISKTAVGWSINRISKTALAILRLAIFEMKFMDDIPVSVSINEAVELAKKYATKEDASFVNGILATVSKEMQND